MRRRISPSQQTKNWCVGFSFPPPAYAGIHPTLYLLYLFGFRANALNSHFSSYLSGFDPGSGASGGPWFGGLRKPSAALQGPPVSRFLASVIPCLADLKFHAPDGLQRPLAASVRRILNFSIFQVTSWGRLASGPPERRPQAPEGQGRWV